MKKKLTALLSVLLVCTFFLTACGSSEFTLKVSVTYNGDGTKYDTIEVQVDGNPYESQGTGMEISFESKMKAGSHTVTLVNPADSSMIASTVIELNKDKMLTIILEDNGFTTEESDLN